MARHMISVCIIDLCLSLVCALCHMCTTTWHVEVMRHSLECLSVLLYLADRLNLTYAVVFGMINLLVSPIGIFLMNR